jgi:phosphoglycolate phosphatase
MTAPPGRQSLDQIIARTRHLLLDFDGPICGIFAGHTDLAVADHLRGILASAGHDELPGEIQASHDPLEIFAYSATVSAKLAAKIQAELTEQEVAAVPTARPNGYLHDVITSCAESGRTVAVVSNNSELAVRTYLDRHGLADRVTAVAARTSSDPSLMKPSAHLITHAVQSLNASATDCVLVGDSVTDIHAAHSAGVKVIGYANRSAKLDSLAAAAAVITSLADLVIPLRARPLPN